MSPPAPLPPARSRLWRGGRLVLLALGVGVLVTVMTIGMAVRQLDHPWLRRHVQAQALALAGIDVDYGATQVRLLSGVRIEGLVVRSPGAYRAAAPELLRVGVVEATWSPRLLWRPGPLLTRLVLRDLALTVVRDPDGRTSLAGLGDPPPGPPPPGPAPTGQPPPGPPPPGPPATPSTPPSRLLASLLAEAPLAERVVVEGAALTLIRRAPGTPDERLRLTGVRLELAAERASGGWRLRAQAGAATAPVALLLTRAQGAAPAGEAALLVWLHAAASPVAAEATLDVQVTRQTFLPLHKVGRAVHVQARVRPAPAAGTTELTLDQSELADGAATVAASVELSDSAGTWPVLRQARGAIDLARLLEVVPAGLVPVRAREALLRFDIAQLALSPVPRLRAGGAASATATFDGLHVALPGAGLSGDGGHLSLKLERTADGSSSVGLTAPLRALRLDAPGGRLSATGLELAVAGLVDPRGAWTGTTSLRWQGAAQDGRARIALREGRLVVRADGLRRTPATAAGDRGALLGMGGGVEVSGQLGALSLAHPAFRAEAQGVGWSARGRLLGHAPYAFDVTLPIEELRLLDPRGRALSHGPARLGLRLSEGVPDDRPLRSRGILQLTLDLGGVRTQASVTKRVDSLDFAVTAAADSLAAVPALLPAGLAGQVPWARIGLSLRSQGKLEALGSAAPLLSHRTEVKLERPGFTRGKVALAAEGVTLLASSRGTARRHEGEADLRLQALSVGGRAVGDGHLTVGLTFDAATPALRLRLGADAPDGPQATVAAALGFDPARRAVSYDLDAHLSRLAPLQPLLASLRALRGFDLAALDLTLSGRGALLGLVDGIGPGGAVRLVPRPLATLGAEGHVELRAAGLRWADGDRLVRTSSVSWRMDLSTEGPRRLLRGDLKTDALHIAFGQHQLDILGVRDTLDLSVTGDLADGEGQLAHQLAARAIRQDLAPGYALRDVSFALAARRSRDGVVRISSLRLDNPAAGTVLNLRGGLELGEERRSLSLRGTLEQRLSPLWSVREDYLGQGTASLTLRVDSGNLSLFHVLASVRVADGHVRLPRRGLAVEALDGEIPLAVDLLLDGRGLRLLRDANVNPYAELRFADQHPLLDRRSFLSAARIVTPLVSFGPLAGNLKMENNLVSISQLEMGLRGGRISGQGLLRWGDKGATMQLHVRATGIEASHKERFDGNAAVIIGARERSIEGRAEILRIGRRHLLDLLELHDPHHADPAVNRVRGALRLGYPDRVRLSFSHGFAAARITFGGLARLVRIDELRGIPTGPIIDKVLAQPPTTEQKGP